MKAGIVFLLCVVIDSSVRGETMSVSSGMIVNDASISASKVYIASNSTLAGSGAVQGSLAVAGTVAPGGRAPGTQTVFGSIAFISGSRFDCDVKSQSALDCLSASGPVTGLCRVSLNPSPGAYPIHQMIVLGNASSSYAGFTPDNTWLWRLESTGSLNLAVTHLRGDTDSDGLPDWWESDHFGGRTNAQPSAHSDADGVDNRSEYIANTDPLDAGSALELADIQRMPESDDVIEWSTAVGRRYYLLVHTNLPRTSWSTAAVITVYGAPLQAWTNTAAGSASLFYEVAVEENAP